MRRGEESLEYLQRMRRAEQLLTAGDEKSRWVARNSGERARLAC
jgi:hypothetical protein